ncbi:MAG: carbohydrate binding domain-containing protein [Acidobacteriota bacterium]|nr:carbohydrate binding domain-containing protein [Acidobacteriota bacterium]
MSIKFFKTDSKAGRMVLIATGVFSIAATVFAAKWSFAHTVAKSPDSTEVAALAVKLGPDDPQTHYAAAVLYEKTFAPEDMEKALSEFETSAALSPNNYFLWLSLGKARERTGDQTGAESALRKALELAPNYSNVQWTLGNALLRQGKTGEGFTEIRKAVSGDPAFTNAAATTAWQLLDGDMMQVRDAIGDSTRLNSAIAILLAGQKRFDEAFEIWNGLPADEKKTTLKEPGETLYRQLAEAKKYRFARRVTAQTGHAENYGDLIGQISNGGFEDVVKTQNAGIFDWRIADGSGPRIGPTEGQKHSGNYSLLISFGAGGKDVRQISQTVAVEPGKSYSFEGFYRADLKTAAMFKWEIANAVDGKVLAATNALASSTDWTALRAEFAIPENIDGVIIRLIQENCAAACQVSGNLWFDDFSLKLK